VYLGIGLRGPQETVYHIARIKVISGDRADGVAAIWSRALAGTCACARRIESGDNTVKSTHEAVTDKVGVDVTSGNRPHRVDGGRKCAIDSVRNVEGGDSAIHSTHEAVKRITRVSVKSRDHPAGLMATG